MLAIGIAAMDGLLCAFVAVLALAFLFQSDERAISGNSETGMLLVSLTKRSAQDGISKPNTLIGLRIRRVINGENCKWQRLPSRVDLSEACALHAVWDDCFDFDAQCAGQLVIWGLRAGETVEAKMIALGPEEQGNYQPDAVWLEPLLLDGAEGPGHRLEPKLLHVVSVSGVHFRISLASTGIARIRWMRAES